MIPTMLVFMIQQSMEAATLSMEKVYSNTVVVMDMESRTKGRPPAVAECVSAQRAKIIRLHEGATKEYQSLKDAADRLDARAVNVHMNTVAIAEEKSSEILRLTQACFSDWSRSKPEIKPVAPAQLEREMDIQEDAPDASPS